jgi:uncharacterized damage-inducible protein DinB
VSVGLLERLGRELLYNAWANREVLRWLEAAQAVPQRAAAVVAHIVGAEWLWLRRLGHSCPIVPVWPELSLAQCGEQLELLARAWKSCLEGLTAAGLEREIRYTNTKGEDRCNTTADVLSHVALHSSYHRGQIASLLRQAGEPAAYSDFIEWARRGHERDGWPV